MPRKLFIGLLLSFASLFIISKVVYAEEQFKIDVSVEYQVKPNAKTIVTHYVTIENLYAEYYAKSYALTLENIDPVSPYASEAGKNLDLTKTVEGNRTTLKVEFDTPLIGKGAKRNFSISFSEDKIVTKTGEVWEISIPRLSDSNSFGLYDVTLLIPNELGQEAYMSPNPKQVSSVSGFTKYLFDKDSVSKTGISGGFGEFQVFSFSLKYHLENPLVKPAYTEIALPPDSYFQKIYYQSLSPEPSKVDLDDDGNWIATYELSPRQKMDISATGAVQIFPEARDGIPPVKSSYLDATLKPNIHWESNDPKIIALAKKFRTPREIYDFVVSYLSYDYQRIKPNVERLGALGAYDNPNSAICMEFTDLFIAIARAAGIPAREVNGYAYTQNPEVEPLSLVADVLHAWPEYWDANRRIWVPVDPTWGSTTGGIDFFNKLDLRHFVFVIHGVDSEKPYPAGSYKLGFTPQKDVFVSFGQLPVNRISKPVISAQIQSRIPLLPPTINIEVKNPGPEAIYNEPLRIYIDGAKKSETTLASLLPYSKFETNVHIPYSFLALDTPNIVTVNLGDSRIEVPTGRNKAIIANLIAVFVIIFIIIIIVLIRLKKFKISFHGFKNIGFFKTKKNKIDQI